MAYNDQVLQLEKELKMTYLDISHRYRLMMKVIDNQQLDLMQSHIDALLTQSISMRRKLDNLRALMNSDGEAAEAKQKGNS